MYGLPVVGEVAKYGEVLRDMRQGQVKEVLWFASGRPGVPDMLDFEGRCLLKYRDDSVKQAVLLPSDLRIRQVGPGEAGRGFGEQVGWAAGSRFVDRRQCTPAGNGRARREEHHSAPGAPPCGRLGACGRPGAAQPNQPLVRQRGGGGGGGGREGGRGSRGGEREDKEAQERKDQGPAGACWFRS